jgi:hypothetical protein
MGLATRIPRLPPHSETIGPEPVVESLERDARSAL